MSRRYWLTLVREEENGEDALWYASRLIESGLYRQAFYDGSVRTPEDFLSLVRNPNGYVFLSKDIRTGLPAGHVHINNFAGKTCQTHFSILPSHHGRESVRMGIEGADQLFELYRAPSELMLTSLIGITPVENKLAVRFLTLCGYKLMGEIDDICEYADGTFHRGLISVRAR